MKYSQLLLVCALPLTLIGCNENTSSFKLGQDQNENLQTKIAFMPDIHFHDVYADFEDESFKGLLNSKSHKYATIRTMLSQMNSTRLFNENYFALIAALDDIVARNIKYVALPGDFSDDGQAVHLRGLIDIFNTYEKDHGLMFFAAPGNHDPVRPFNQPAGKSNYLGEHGQEQRIFSKGKNECQDYDEDTITINNGTGLDTICTQEVQHLGYESVMSMLSDFGFYPQESYLYYDTPYTQSQNVKTYSYETAQKEATFSNRHYEICYEGTGGVYKQDNYTSCSMVPDSTYLVEPVEGVWLLAIDANVYRPKLDSTGGEGNSNDYDGSSNAGYNLMLTHKQHVIEWIKDVVQRAKTENKVLLGFSHFPMTDFYNGADQEIEAIFGANNFQLKRLPESNTSRVLAETGLSIHVGGHMHFNDTGITKHEKEGQSHTLFNIQAPSLAGHVPAYKILTLNSAEQIEVQTVILDEVNRFDELFEHYEEEHEHLTTSNAEQIWNKEILGSKSYTEFTNWHITELTRLRFLPSEWPEYLRDMLFNMTGSDMLILSQLESDLTYCEFKSLALNTSDCVIDEETLEILEDNWQEAKTKATDTALKSGTTIDSLDSWSGIDLATDFYRLRNADELAFRDISAQKLTEYDLLNTELSEYKGGVSVDEFTDLNTLNMVDLFRSRFGSLFSILHQFSHDEASDHFLIDLEKGTLEDLTPHKTPSQIHHHSH